jgi:hypothetical protein
VEEILHRPTPFQARSTYRLDAEKSKAKAAREFQSILPNHRTARWGGGSLQRSC